VKLPGNPLRLLERWAERENIRLNGRALIIPQITYRWALNPIGGFEIVGEGICSERSTAIRKHDKVDEFGHCIRSLDTDAQALIIVGHFGGKREWDDLRASLSLSPRSSRLKLKLAWLRLLNDWSRREREWAKSDG
jgi:hypothetical protein